MPEPLSARKINLDGSRNIFCSRCHEFICSIAGMEAFHSALCVICQAADRGEVLPEDLIRQLRSRKVGENYIPLILAEPDRQLDPMVGEQSLSGRVEFYIKVISRKTKEIVAEIKAQSKQSRAIAADKKRKRVFDKPIDE